MTRIVSFLWFLHIVISPLPQGLGVQGGDFVGISHYHSRHDSPPWIADRRSERVNRELKWMCAKLLCTAVFCCSSSGRVGWLALRPRAFVSKYLQSSWASVPCCAYGLDRSSSSAQSFALGGQANHRGLADGVFSHYPVPPLQLPALQIQQDRWYRITALLSEM